MSRAVTVQRTLEVPGVLAWVLAADTNRQNRALGLPAPAYSWRRVEGRRQLVGTAVQGGVRLEWVQPPYEWIEGRFLRGMRYFSSGPAQSGGISVAVEDVPEGCRVEVSAFGDAQGMLMKALGPLIRLGMRRRLEGFLASIESALAGLTSQQRELPPVEVAQQWLARHDASAVSGAATPSDAAELERRAKRLAQTPVDERAAQRLVDALGRRPDEELAQMRPFELARAWELDRAEVLRTFLYATQAGLVDLQWQINCPVCKVAAGVVRSLGEVEKDIHCEACNIRYDIDFGANVEAVFRCNAAVRSVQPQVYCVASPVFRPHVIAQLRVGAGESLEHDVELSDGRLHVRTLGREVPADVEQAEVPARVDIVVRPEQVEVAATGDAKGAASRVTIRSELDDECYVLLERGAWASDAVLGSVVATMPEFVDLFATEAPAAGLELSIGNLTLLFSDLTGSTALYERVGDARAYAVVQEHFAAMERAVHDHEGAIVKTMGDAVMATFATPALAVRAARSMVAESAARHAELGIGIKLGVHEGPCLAVRANERLDFFGTTVNVAARLQGQARTSELVVTEQLASEAAIADVVGRLPSRSFVARLKGIESEQKLVAFDLSASPPDTPG